MKNIKSFDQFVNENKKMNESTYEGREKYQGLNYQIWRDLTLGYFVKGIDTETKNIFKANQNYFDKYKEIKEHVEITIDNYLEEGVDYGKKIEINEGKEKNPFIFIDDIVIELDHQINQAQIIRSDIIKSINPKELKNYDKALQKLRIAITEFSSVFK